MFVIHFIDGSTYECETFEYGTLVSECDGIAVSTSMIEDVEEVE